MAKQPRDDDDDDARPPREQFRAGGPRRSPADRARDDDDEPAPSERVARERASRDRPRRRDEDDDDRPRRRRRDDDTVATIIPYRNGMALAAYYVGVFSLIPAVGALLGPMGVIFGIAGLRRVSANPEAKGTGHAIAGIVLGGIGALYNWALVAFFLIGVFGRGR